MACLSWVNHWTLKNKNMKNYMHNNMNDLQSVHAVTTDDIILSIKYARKTPEETLLSKGAVVLERFG